MQACNASGSSNLLALSNIVRRSFSSRPRRIISIRQLSAGRQSATVLSRNLSGLGVRSHRPPDSIPENEPNNHQELSDQEWLIRTGRAIYVLQETLPDFFKTGLFTSVDKTTGSPVPPTSPLTPVNFFEHTILHRDDEEHIYARDIRLSYTPPNELPAPFPKTFHIEGLQMYLASSSLLRHTMSALYTDLVVVNLKLSVDTPTDLPQAPTRNHPMSREKSIRLRQSVTGIARVSGKPAEWEIESTYAFSPTSGLVYRHVVNSIRPAPHQAVYDLMRGSLGKLLGLEWGGGSPTPGGAAFKGDNTRNGSS